MDNIFMVGSPPEEPRKGDDTFYIGSGGYVLYNGKVNELLARLPGEQRFKVTIRIPFSLAVDTIFWSIQHGKWLVEDPGEPITNK